MKVVLLADVPKLGNKSEIKNVTPGYAKNYLFPRGLAMVLTSTAVLELEQQNAAKRVMAEKELVQIQTLAKKMDGLEVEVSIKTSKEGAGYAAVSARKIAETLQKLGYDVKKNQVQIKEPIKKVGEHAVTITLPHDLEVEIKVIVVPEGEDQS